MNSTCEAGVLARESMVGANGCHTDALPERGHSAAPPILGRRQEKYCEKTATISMEAPVELTAKLSQITKDEPLLYGAAINAALSTCLYRYTGSSPVAIGSPALKAAEPAKVTVTLYEAGREMTFRQLLLEARQKLLESSNRTYLASKLMQEGSCEQINRCPFFDVALVVKGLHCDMPEMRHDITLTFSHEAKRSLLQAEFSSMLYDRDTITRFCGHIFSILRSGLEETSRHVSDLSLLSGEEKQRLLIEWNQTATKYPADTCVHQLFEQQAARNPQRIAVVCGSQRLTYGELDQRANQVAHFLQRLNIAPDAPVGVFLSRSIEQVVGILGILKAGAAYVPYDPAYPRERLAGMFSDLEPAAIVTSERLANRLPQSAIPRIYLDRDAELISRESTARPAVHPGRSNLCYVIFTSGSTGRAKAAAVYHGGWTNLLNWFVRNFNVTPSDKTLVMSSISFDITQRAMAMPLVSGGELHLAPSDHYEPELILNIIEEQKITLLNCAPSTFYPLVESYDSVNEYLRLGSLRVLFLGGEAISASRLKSWAASSNRHAVIANVYGAAECSDVSASYVLQDFNRYVESSVPIGKPIYNTQIYLLDEDLQLVPEGIAGEICLAGDGVGKGYINDATLTEKKFRNNPFGPGKLYPTGDMARYLPDGTLEFLGRLDTQVKIRGQRVELGEIEAALRQQTQVREAVVIQSQLTPDYQRLVAYIVAKTDVTSTMESQFIEEIRAALTNKLPQYMMPNVFVLLKEMPLSPNGKIDRGVLPTPSLAKGTPVSDPPQTETEKAVASIFSRILAAEHVGLNENFFNLGGHSLLVTQAIAAISDTFHTQFQVADFYKDPTVTGIVKILEEVKPVTECQAAS